MRNLLHKSREAALKRHKTRQRNGLWCEPGCNFHREKAAEAHWAAHIGGWSFLYCDAVDKLATEGLFDEDREQILRDAQRLEDAWSSGS